MIELSSCESLVRGLLPSVQGDTFWESYFEYFITQECSPFALHLAVMVEPYLQFVLDGKKTIESRFSVHRCPPYKKAQKGDVIFLKQSGGPIVGICQISDAWFYQLDPVSWITIKKDFAAAICAQDPEFWTTREAASFATLLRIKHVKPIEPIPYAKRDRRGWVVLQYAQLQLRLEKI
jgi:hypothetical protein